MDILYNYQHYKFRYNIYVIQNKKYLVKKIPILNKKKLLEISEILNILKLIKHYSFLSIYNWKLLDNSIYIISDYKKCSLLSKYIYSNKKISEKNIIHIIYQLLSCLKRLHNENICIGNINIHNILLIDEKYFNIILYNYDYVQIYKDKSFTKINNKIEYCAPEIFNYSYTNKCDIWSVGCILYILLTKSNPFLGFNTLQIINNIQHKKFNIPLERLDINFNILHLLYKSFELDHKKRINANTAVKLNLFKFYC